MGIQQTIFMKVVNGVETKNSKGREYELKQIKGFPKDEGITSVLFYYSERLKEWVLKWNWCTRFTNAELKELVKISNKLNQIQNAR